HIGRPLPNAVLLGGFAALAGMVSLEAVVHAIGHTFAGKVAESNVAAATEAHAFVQQEMNHAQAD
ncbi:MAG TPA: 2-oxoacid:acceptor oxidoreductase family protein, partial [Rubrivivax sp.]|nr:2-oxoacid:acceptor oxidoreductase family protein [Rubrivivax sp.]